MDFPEAPVPLPERLLAEVDAEDGSLINEKVSNGSWRAIGGKDLVLAVSRDFYDFQEYAEMDAVEEEYRHQFEGQS